jgi:transcription elongation factor Elf1
MKSLMAALILVAFSACSSNTSDENYDPNGLGMGKADDIERYRSGLGCEEIVDQVASDITVLKAELIGDIKPSSSYMQATYKLDCSQCEVLTSQDVYNESYDEYKEMSIDCKNELEKMTDLPFVSDAVFERVYYTAMTYPEDHYDVSVAGQTVEEYFSEYINCSILQITTASRADEYAVASGIGFYYYGQINFIPAEELVPAGEVTLKDGTPGILHHFGAIAVCWAGSMSSSTNNDYDFKPFLTFVDGDTCYSNWDVVPDNYVISSSVNSFDRSSEVLQTTFEGCQEEIDQVADDITVLKAELIGDIKPSSSYMQATYKLDCGQCEVLESIELNDGNDQYDVYEELTVDCKGELERMTELPFVSEGIFERVYHTVVTYPEDYYDVNLAGQTVDSYSSQYINCKVLKITTLSQADTFYNSTGIGFYYDHQTQFIPADNLNYVGQVTLKNGEPGVLHDFGALAVCWLGSMSSSTSYDYEFKPFLTLADGGTCYNNWDNVSGNYIISSSVEAFDRSEELLQ